MALKKQIILTNGVLAQYHRIFQIRKNGTILDLIVESYISKDYREQSSNNFVDMRYYTFNDVEPNVSFESLYDLLKTHEDFQGAEDV